MKKERKIVELELNIKDLEQEASRKSSSGITLPIQRKRNRERNRVRYR